MIKRLWLYAKKYRKYFILACVCIISETVFELVIPMLMANIIDVGVTNKDTNYIVIQGILMMICAVIAYILGVLYARLQQLLDKDLGQKLEKMNLKKFRIFHLRILIIFQHHL